VTAENCIKKHSIVTSAHHVLLGWSYKERRRVKHLASTEKIRISYKI